MQRDGLMEKQAVGQMGEELAVQYLERRGWEIVGRNIRHGRGEVDIIASKGPILTFVEVKCRRDDGMGHPMEAITRSKRLEVARVARGWVRGRTIPPGTLIRFDAIGVIYGNDRGPELIHVQDAWRCE